MASPSYSILYSAVVAATADDGLSGDVLIKELASGEYVLATTANRDGRRSTGIALSDYVAGNVVSLQQEGEVEATLAGLGIGTASQVIVSALGRLERSASPGPTDDVVGYVETDGTLHLRCGQIPGGYGSGGGGGATLPIVLTTDVSGILPEANGGTGSASLPAGGLAGLTALAAGDAASVATAAADATTKANAAQAAAIAASQPLDADLTSIATTGLGAGVATLLAATPSGTAALAGTTSPTFRTGILLNNPANTFAYTLTPGAIAANRILNIPVITATDTLAVLALGQTFTTKTMVLASNTITDTSQALGDIAYCNGTRFVRFARGATAGQSLTATATTIAYSSNPGVAAQAVAALAIDWTAGRVFTKTLAAGGNTFTFSNAASGMVITVRLTSNGGGSTVTWPTVLWAGGVAPTQTSTGVDVYTFVHDGTNIYGSVVQAMA